jgi:hypothetical protein
MAWWSKWQQPSATVVNAADEELVWTAQGNRTAAALRALDEGGDPTLSLMMEGQERTAFEEAIRHHNAVLVDAFLTRGFLPSLAEVEQAVRAAQRAATHDTSDPDRPDSHAVIRALFVHGERFQSPAHEGPTGPTLAEVLQRDAPALRLTAYTWADPAPPLEHRPGRPVARTERERHHLTLALGLIAHRQDLDALDQIRHLLDRGANPHAVPREVGHPQTLVQIALHAPEPHVLRLCLQRGLVPSTADKAQLAHRLLPARDEAEEHATHGPQLSPTHAMIRLLWEHGERFDQPAPSDAFPACTIAEIIRTRSPVLAQAWPTFSPSVSSRLRQSSVS